MKRNKKSSPLGKIFGFTLRQMLRNKAYITTLVIFFVLMLASVPYAVISGGGSVKNDATTTECVGSSGFRTIFVDNETKYLLDVENLGADNAWYESTSFETADFAPEDWKSQIAADEAFVQITEASDNVQLEVQLLDETIAGGFGLAGEMEELQSTLQDALQQARYEAAGVDPSALSVLTEQVQTEVNTMEEYESARAVPWETQYAIQLVYSILVLILSTYTISYIVQSVSEEKNSKLVEFLTVSVRPQQLIVGKILACMAFVGILLLVMAAGFVLSYIGSGFFLEVPTVGEWLTSVGLGNALSGMSPLLIVIVLISLAIGYGTFSLIAGLCGASCQSPQDVQRVSMIPTMLLLAGYLVAILTPAVTGQAANLAFALLPIVSLFCTPVLYATGVISFGIVLVSWVIQIIILLALIRVSGGLYEELLFHRGGRISIRNLFVMTKKEGGRK